MNYINNNPWKGAAAYEEADSNIFKGRNDDIEKYLRMLHSSTTSVIYANTGVGKTSFLNAGIFPLLKEEGYFVVRILFTDSEFNESPEKLILNKIREEGGWENTLEDKEDIIPSLCDNSLWWFLYANRHKDGKMLLLVFDQFEEVFNKGNKIFLEELFRVIEDIAYNIVPNNIAKELEENEKEGKYVMLDRSIRYKVVFALRKEYLSEFDYWTNDKHSCTGFWRNRLPLRPLTREQARKVITQQGVNTFDNVVDNILNDLDDRNEDEVEPILLSVLCHDLYLKNEGNVISPTDYKSENSKSIIRRFYENNVNEVFGKKLQRQKKYEHALVDNKSGIRKRIGEEQLSFMTRGEIEELEKRHIVRRNGDTIELIHDKVAEVVFERMQEEVQTTKSANKLFGLILLFVFVIIAMFWFTSSRTVLNQWANRSAIYSKIVHPGVWSSADMELSDGAGIKREILWNKKERLYIEGNYSLEKLTIDVDTVDIRSLYNCPNLREVTLTNNVKVVISSMGYVGQLCDSVIYNIGDSVQSIDDNLFQNNPHAIINLSNNNPFFQCDYIYNPNNRLKTDYATLLLWDKRNLSVIFIGNGFVHKKDSVLQFPEAFAKKDSVFIPNERFGHYLYNDTNYYVERQSAFTYRKYKEFKVRTGYSIVGDYCFQNCPNLQQVNLSDIKTIGPMAFAECHQLREIDISKVSSIDNLAFQNCYNLSKVVMPDDSISLGSGAFMGCRSLREIKFPKVLSLSGAIEFSTFRSCTNLTTVYLPDSLTPSSVSTELVSLFAFCPNLKNIYFTQRSHFNWKADSLLCYDDIPVYFNKKAKRPTWCSPDSSYFFDGSLLFKNESYGERKKGELVDVYLGQGEPVGYTEQPARLSVHFYFEDSFIGANDPTLFFPATNDTSIYIKPCEASTYTFINPDTRVKEIHLPYVDPWMVGIDLSLVPIEKKDIVLYVPWGSKRDYESKAVFRGFKEIREDGVWRWISDVASADFVSFVKDILLLIICVICMLLSYVLFYYEKKLAVVSCLVAFIGYYIAYWLCFHTLANHVSISYNMCRVISICISILFAIGMASLFCKNLLKIYRLSYK